jgi:hypothetical protein
VAFGRENNGSQTSGLFFNFFFGCGIALGSLCLGIFVERSVGKLKGPPTVVVKGLVERLVESDKATLDILFSSTGSDLKSLTESAKNVRETLVSFLLKHGFPIASIDELPLAVHDFHQLHTPTKYNIAPPKDRYEVMLTLLLYSNDMDQISLIYKKLQDFSYEGHGFDGRLRIGYLSYEYTKLEDIRADMIAEGVSSARKIADQFAKDSKCKVGQILRANQGTIGVQDEGDGRQKKARVVCYLTYTLV